MGRRVLIVEDEVINAMGLAEVLPTWGCVVADMVASGEAAVRAAETLAPDIVLMDISIEGSVDGLAAAREIIGRLGIPVIFMTGYDDDETLEAAAALEPRAILVKPLDLAFLKELLAPA